MKKLLLIAAMAMFATVACDKKIDPVTPPVPAGAPDATIVAAPASVAMNATGKLTATLSKAAEGDVTIAVANSNATALTVGTEIKIAKGATSASIDFTGKAEGSAALTLTSSTANVKTTSVTITVTKEATPTIEYDYPTSEYWTYYGMSKVVIGATTLTSSCGDSEEGTDKPLSGNDDFGAGVISDDRTATKVPLTDGIAFTIFADNFTSTNSKYDIFFYIDFNKDGKLDDATELVKVQKGVNGGTKAEITGTITIPAAAAAESRCRIIIANEDNNIEDGIGDMDSGYFMDFTYTK